MTCVRSDSCRGQAVGNYSDETFLPQNLWILPLTTILSVPKTMAGVGTCEEDLQRCISVAAVVQDRSGRWFPERGCILEHQIFRFAKIYFAWQVQHFVWPGITFSWQAQYFRQVDWKNRKTQWYEAVSSALNFPFWKEVSQNCFVFWCCQLKKWGSLAELLRFWRCQAQKLRKSRWLAAFLMLSSSKTGEFLQNSFVVTLADRQIDRQTDR